MTHTPHDLISKNFLSDLNVAKDMIRAYLPAEILNRCNLDSLRLEATNYVEEDLRPYFLDVLYSVDIDDQTALIYILIEPQHKPLRLMPLRMLRYVLAPLKQYAEKHGDKAKLPVVIPIILYSGKRSPYPYSVDFFECFNDPELAKRVLLNPKLIDLSVLSGEELKAHGYAAFLELTLKHVQNRDMLKLAQYIVELLRDHPLTGNLFKHMLNYVLESGESENYDEFLNTIINQTATDYKETTMTIAEQLRQEGKQIGYQEGMHDGIEKGFEKGEHEKAVAIAKNLFLQGVDLKIIKFATSLSDEELAKLFKAH